MDDIDAQWRSNARVWLFCQGTYLPDDDGKQNDDWGEDDEGGYNGGP